MTEQTSLIEQIEEQLEPLVADLEKAQDLTGLYQTKQLALACLENLEFPTSKHEEWKYTPVSALLETGFQIEPETTLSPEKIQENLPDFDHSKANVLVFVNGHFSAENSNIQDTNLEVKHFKDLDFNADIFTNRVGKIASIEQEIFTAVNTAISKNGIYLKIPKNQVIEHPVLLYFLADGSDKSAFIQPRNFIDSESGSQATIIELFSSIADSQTFTNAVTEVRLENNAVLDHYKIQLEGVESSHIGTVHAHQYQDSKFTNTTISLDGNIIRNNLNINLDGENCTTYMNGFYMPFGATHIDNHTAVDHLQPNSYSNELYKGILGDTGTAVFNGKIFVRQYAQKTNAFQSNKNILLSSEASVNAKPQLEIWADDVKCSHGCTTGALDEDPMFYLRSRGIPELEARKLLLFAFAGDVLERIKVESVRTFIESWIHQKLDNYNE